MSHIYTKGISKLLIIVVTALIAIIVVAYFFFNKDGIFAEKALETPAETTAPVFTTIPSAGVSVSMPTTTSGTTTATSTSTPVFRGE